MRIAQVAPLFEPVPPRGYGGTERIVSYLTEELVRQGHQVTLFASADSVTEARLVPGSAQGLRTDPACKDPVAAHVTMLEGVARQAPDFDIVHFHTGYLHFPMVRRQPLPHVTTLHGRLDMPEFVALHEEFREVPVVSISHSQRMPAPNAAWQNTIYHGLPADLYHREPGDGGYLAFVGRMSPEKGVHEAIEIAKRMNMPLRLAAKIEVMDIDYFEGVVKPLLDHP